MLVVCMEGTTGWTMKIRLLQTIDMQTLVNYGVSFLFVKFLLKTADLHVAFSITSCFKIGFLENWSSLQRKVGEDKERGSQRKTKELHKWPKFLLQRLLPLQPGPSLPFQLTPSQLTFVRHSPSCKSSFASPSFSLQLLVCAALE